jgi:hypothetical protein
MDKRLLNPRVAVIAGGILLIVLGTLPVLFSFPGTLSFKLLESSPVLRFTGQTFVVLFLLAIIFLIAKMDSMPTPMKLFLYGGFLLLALVLTDLHWQTVDTMPVVNKPGQLNMPLKFNWQMTQYINILEGKEIPPHQYRFLPQGILWWIFLLGGSFRFAYNTYRCFFTFAVLLSLYKLSRMYNPHKESLIVVFLYAILYPLSVRYYYGNMLDPMLHSIFFMALIYCQKRKMPEFFLLVTLGMFVKETIILVLPCYYLLNMELPFAMRKKMILQLGLLAGWCLVLFLACRIPFGFHYDNKTLNGVSQLMIMDNLGFGGRTIPIPVWVRYAHPALFIFMWLGILILYRKFISRPLFYTAIYLSVSIYLTNLCFGWNYESRNFIPAFGVLAVAAMSIFNQMKTQPAEL